MICLFYALLVPKSKHPIVQGFFAGMAVSFFCLQFLPTVFETGLFYIAVAGVLCGVALGTAVEQKSHWYTRILFLCAGLLFHTPDIMYIIFVLCGSLCGGSCLYLCCAQVLPELCTPKEGAIRAGAGLLGFWLGVCVDFFL